MVEEKGKKDPESQDQDLNYLFSRFWLCEMT